MSRCLAEFCANWTGDGCICRVLDLDPVDAREDRPDPGCGECGGTGLVRVITQEPPDDDERECPSCSPYRQSASPAQERDHACCGRPRACEAPTLWSPACEAAGREAVAL